MIFKVQNLPKSIWKAIPNDDGPRNRWKPLPAPSWGALFSVWLAFLSILGSYLAPRLASLDRLSADFRDFLANFGPPCGFSSIEAARGECWDRFWLSGGPPGRDFGTILDHSLRRFGHLLHPSFVPTSSQVCPNSRSVVALPLVLALVGLPLSCRGGGRAERVKLRYYEY